MDALELLRPPNVCIPRYEQHRELPLCDGYIRSRQGRRLSSVPDIFRRLVGKEDESTVDEHCAVDIHVCHWGVHVYQSASSRRASK